MTEKQPAQSAMALIEEVRASASWTKDLPGRVLGLPPSVRAHLDMVEDLLGRVGAALLEHFQGDDEVLPHKISVDAHAARQPGGAEPG